ncbi:YdbL family protein [Qipengyuania sp. ASV99]|uniref:YdbL family protein n=1 Tax=Qipengyuania sp. ASV99 TaxID=3399681 RepID=UPI003A4C816A
MTTLRHFGLASAAALAAIVAVTGFVAPAQAQRDPAYAAARASGAIGEKTDGYIGIVGTATPELQRLVNDINNRRRTVYTDKANENEATVEQYAITAGCQAIARTVPGEKYQAPDGSWKTRTDAPPERMTICP